jgi:hypothetical protein
VKLGFAAVMFEIAYDGPLASQTGVDHPRGGRGGGARRSENHHSLCVLSFPRLAIPNRKWYTQFQDIVFSFLSFFFTCGRPQIQ